MRSMTGFGSGECRTENSSRLFRVEISSVNRKQFELKVTLPREMLSLENAIRKCVGEKVSRGALLLRAEVLTSAGTAVMPQVKINKENLASLRKEMEALAMPESTFQNILSVPGIVEQVNEGSSQEENEAALLDACRKAVDALVKMRTTEGGLLKEDLAGRIGNLENMLAKVEPEAALLPAQAKERLLKKLADAGLSVDINDERVLREVVIFADKLDVNEEITRLKSHFAHFRSFLANEKEALGRNMDFLTQEIFREINTLGNKTGTTSISPVVVQMKAEAEKIREQVQNVE